MKKELFVKLLLFALLVVSTSSCRDSFEFEDFDDPLIFNQPPSPVFNELNAISGIEMSALNIRKLLTDPEGDPFDILGVSSGNPNVATVIFEDPNVIFTEVGTGTSEIAIRVDDGTEREDNEVSFDLVIAEPDHQVTIVFQSIPNNSLFNAVEGIGGTFEYIEGSEGTELTVNNWILEIQTDEFAAFELAWDEPLDLSSDATLSFEYAELNNPIFGIGIFDDSEGEVWIVDDLPGIVLNSSAFNSYTIDLNDYADELDLTSIIGVWFEKYGASPDSPHSFKLRNTKIGEL